ncbi:hypothetical protein SCALM49S_04688 [Streptomyces californicus]
MSELPIWRTIFRRWPSPPESVVVSRDQVQIAEPDPGQPLQPFPGGRGDGAAHRVVDPLQHADQLGDLQPGVVGGGEAVDPGGERRRVQPRPVAGAAHPLHGEPGGRLAPLLGQRGRVALEVQPLEAGDDPLEPHVRRGGPHVDAHGEPRTVQRSRRSSSPNSASGRSLSNRPDPPYRLHSQLPTDRPGSSSAPSFSDWISRTVGVDSLADEVGWSRKRLWSRFRSQLGLAPKHAARLVRFDHAARLLAAGHPAARVAASTGYADQPHLHREVRAFTGMTPTALAAAPWLAIDDVAWPAPPADPPGRDGRGRRPARPRQPRP